MEAHINDPDLKGITQDPLPVEQAGCVIYSMLFSESYTAPCTSCGAWR